MAGSLYDPLPDLEFIRYIVLSSGRDNDTLTAEIVVAPLHSIPYFEAISYVWGNTTLDHEIICNGKSLSITQNLWNALKSLRLPQTSRALWADSVCINQDDVVEKAHQVSLMGQIYSNANKVMIFLGGHKVDEARAAASLIDEIDEMIMTRTNNAAASCQPFPFPTPDEQRRRIEDQRWKSLLELSGEAWFTRGWVVQEAGLAADAVILWSGTEISWVKMIRTWLWMEQRLPEVLLRYPNTPDNMNVSHLDIYGTRHQPQMTALYPPNSPEIFVLNIFHYSRALQFAEPSDRVYALLGITSSTTINIHMQPDYSRDFREVYLDLARQFLDLTRSIELLDYIQHTESTIEEKFPSWVPRWDVDVFDVKVTSSHRSTSRSQLIPASIGNTFCISHDNILRVRCVLFDRVDFISDIFDKPSVEELGNLWNTLTPRVRSQSPYATPDHELAFTQTISLGRRLGSAIQWQGCQTAYIQHLKQRGGHDRVDEKEFHALRHWVQTCTHNRCFTLTQRGYFGLGPSLSRKGDICCVLDGAMSAFVLREASTPDHFRIIGQIYIPSKRKTVPSPVEQSSDMFSLCEEGGRDWVELGLERQDIHLC